MQHGRCVVELLGPRAHKEPTAFASWILRVEGLGFRDIYGRFQDGISLELF